MYDSLAGIKAFEPKKTRTMLDMSDESFLFYFYIDYGHILSSYVPMHQLTSQPSMLYPIIDVHVSTTTFPHIFGLLFA